MFKKVVVKNNMILTRKSERLRNPPVRYQEPEVLEALLCQQETLSFDNIKFLLPDDKSLWEEIMYAEIESMKINDVWDLGNLPSDERTISSI